MMGKEGWTSNKDYVSETRVTDVGRTEAEAEMLCAGMLKINP